MSARTVLVTVLGLAALFRPAGAMAAIDDLQIDWVIPVGNIDEKTQTVGASQNIVVNPVPRRMFESDEDIKTPDGLRLLPAHSPLYAMLGHKFMVCSQSVAPAAYVARKDRVCLRDTDGDGKLDSYFTRSRGRSFMAGDQMWFAMNSNIPPAVGVISPTQLKEVDRMRAPERPKLDFSFTAPRDGTVRFSVVIEGEHTFSTECLEMKQQRAQSDGDIFSCLDPGFQVI